MSCQPARPRQSKPPVGGGLDRMHTQAKVANLAGPVTVRREVRPTVEALDQWDQLIDRTLGTDVTQLSAWARIRRTAGYSPVYLMAYQDGRVVGGALLLRRRLFRVLDIAYLPYG